MSDAKDLKKAIGLLIADGWEKVPGRHTHIKLRHPDLGQLTLSGSPGKGRAYLNACAEINRAYRAAGRTSPLRSRQ